MLLPVNKRKQLVNTELAETLLQRYQVYIAEVKKYEQCRLGYPVVGAFEHSLNDSDYELGIVPGSIIDTYLNNIGDPYDIPESFKHHAKEFECEVIEMCSQFLGLDELETKGYITNGGTEGNLAGLWWGRNYCQRKLKSSTAPAVIISDQAHYSLNKIINQLAVQQVSVPSNTKGQIDLDAFAEIILKNQQQFRKSGVVIVLTAGTTELGAIDDVLAIRKIINKSAPNITFYIHLDAAMVGFALPVLYPLEYKTLCNSVHSISISFHKLLPSRAIISGIVLTHKQIIEKVYHDSDNCIGYIGKVKDITASGSRSGFIAISLHYRLTKLGLNRDGNLLKNKIRRAILLARFIYQKLSAIYGSELVHIGDTCLNVIFPRNNNEFLMQKYSVMPISNNRYSICVLGHVSKKTLLAFIEDIKLTGVRA